MARPPAPPKSLGPSSWVDFGEGLGILWVFPPTLPAQPRQMLLQAAAYIEAQGFPLRLRLFSFREAFEVQMFIHQGLAAGFAGALVAGPSGNQPCLRSWGYLRLRLPPFWRELSGWQLFLEASFPPRAQAGQLGELLEEGEVLEDYPAVDTLPASGLARALESALSFLKHSPQFGERATYGPENWFWSHAGLPLAFLGPKGTGSSELLLTAQLYTLSSLLALESP